MRFIGFFFLLLAISALAWDVWHILNGGGIHSFSGITAIWNSLDKGSFQALQQGVLNLMGSSVWNGVIKPAMNIPAFLIFGSAGLIFMRKHSHEIQARAPSSMEIEMIKNGMPPRQARRLCR
jgi:hypothetical protein